MKTLVSVIADHAWVDNTGCLTICRAFDTIQGGKFPFTIPRIAIALRFLIGKSEIGMHKLDVSLVDPDGKKLMHADVNINVQSPPESIPETSFSFALNGQNVIFPRAGDYGVNILVNGKAEPSIPIYVREKK